MNPHEELARSRLKRAVVTDNPAEIAAHAEVAVAAMLIEVGERLGAIERTLARELS